MYCEHIQCFLTKNQEYLTKIITKFNLQVILVRMQKKAVQKMVCIIISLKENIHWNIPEISNIFF